MSIFCHKFWINLFYFEGNQKLENNHWDIRHQNPYVIDMDPLKCHIQPTSKTEEHVKVCIQWTPLNRITLGQTITDPINRMIKISQWASTYFRYERVIWDLSVCIHLIPLSVIPLSVFKSLTCKVTKLKRTL